MIARVDNSMFGPVLWLDKKPSDYQMVFVRDRIQPPRREMLGHLDESRWAYSGQDPWQMTFAIPFHDPNDGSAYTFTTSSAGGRDAVADLFEAFSADKDKHPGKLPLVKLGRDSYVNKRGGVVAIPVFKVTKWVAPPPDLKPISLPTSSSEPTFGDRLIEHEPTEHVGPKLVESKPQDRTAFERKPFARDEIDDDIPF